jgi:hypothetical protein
MSVESGFRRILKVTMLSAIHGQKESHKLCEKGVAAHTHCNSKLLLVPQNPNNRLETSPHSFGWKSLR